MTHKEIKHKSVWLRVGAPYLWVTLVGILCFMFLGHMLMPESMDRQELLNLPNYVLMAMAFNLGFRFLVFLDESLDQKYSWYLFPKKRLFFQVAISVPILFGWLTLSFLFIKMVNGIPDPTYIGKGAWMGIILDLLVIFLLMTILIAKRSIQNVIRTTKEIEEIKQEKLIFEYQALQDQLNPHFLFNSLNVLISEISYDPNNAVSFTRKLSDVYRYVLQSKGHDLISLEKELGFVKSYLFLHQVRFGPCLELQTLVPDEQMQKVLPPLTLQLLVENAIKHNIISQDKPLKITISTDGDFLIVSNPLQPKRASGSTGTGLQNLHKRFRLIAGKKIEVTKDQTHFRVKVPLLFL